MSNTSTVQNTEHLPKKINQFIDFFAKKVETIELADFRESDQLFRKILYVSIIDTLAKTALRKCTRNRQRVVSLVRKFSGWPDYNRVSLPHLVRLLEKQKDPKFTEVKDYAYSLLSNWGPSEIVSLSRDPDFDEVNALWPDNSTVNGIGLDYLSHASLFYTYRNSLIHELREPGHAIEGVLKSEQPFYHSMIDKMDQESWELAYPMGFYRKICTNFLQRLGEYYVSEELNPYECFTFGTYWIEELNL